jgi:ABC-type enterochelin transport system ATPase subunit
MTTHVLFLKNGTIFSKGIKNKMLTGHELSKAFDCDLELKKNQGDIGL